VEKEGNVNKFLKLKNAMLLTSRASFQIFTKTVMKTGHVDCVA
jgi:formate dehydrogenase assembly factor FdhD